MARSALWRMRMLLAFDCKVLQRDLLGCAPVAPERVRRPQRLVGAAGDLRPRERGAGWGGLSSRRAAAAAAGPGSGARRRPGRGAM